MERGSRRKSRFHPSPSGRIGALPSASTFPHKVLLLRPKGKQDGWREHDRNEKTFSAQQKRSMPSRKRAIVPVFDAL